VVLVVLVVLVVPGAHLLAEDEEGPGVGGLVAAEGAVDGGLVDQRLAPPGGQDLPLLLVDAHVGVAAEGQQRHHQVQPPVRSHRVERLGRQALCGDERSEVAGPGGAALEVRSGTFGEPGVDQDLLQLHFGLPGHPERRHVQTLVLTEPDLCVLAADPERRQHVNNTSTTRQQHINDNTSTTHQHVNTTSTTTTRQQ